MTPPPGPILDYAAAPARRIRLLIWVFCIAILFGGTGAWLFLLRDWRILDNDRILLGGWIGLGAVIVIVAILLRTAPSDAIRLSTRSSRWIVIGGTAGLQLAALVLTAPALSEDVVRYRLDGRMWLSGVSPYANSPWQFLERRDRADAIDALVTFPHLNTIYPPAAQALFVAARAAEDASTPILRSRLAGSWRDWVPLLPRREQALILRSMIAIVAVCATGVLISLLAHAGRSPWYAILLGWNPLFVIETGGMGHVDIVGVLFVLLMIRAVQSNRAIVASAMLALAAGVKPPALLLAPFLLRDARARTLSTTLALLVFVAIVFVPALAYQRGYVGWITTLQTYAKQWEANGSIYNLIKATGDPTDGWAVERAKQRARALAAAAVVAALLLAWMLRADLAHAGYWIYLVALLTAPVVYPWYLLWVLCFVPLLRGWQGITALIWSATIGISYLLWRTSDWVLPTRWLLVEYLPVYLALSFEVSSIVHRKLWGRAAAISLPD